MEQDYEILDEESQENEYVEEVEVSTRGVDFSVRELLTLIDEEELIIPNFQRELVWDLKRKSRFIESILLGYPIPGMFFTEYDENSMMIIDGQQRITTLRSYINNEFKISNINEINPKWRNKHFYEIEPSYQRKLKSSNIRASVFQVLSATPDEKSIALYSLFERINTGSIKLNDQEIRRAIYFGEYVTLLNEFVETINWKMTYKMIEEEEASRTNSDKRLLDQEIISRYFAFKGLIEGQTIEQNSVSYKKEINNYMNKAKKYSYEQVYEIFESLSQKLEWLKNQAKENNINVGSLFRRHIFDAEENKYIPTKKFNIPLFEAIILQLEDKDLEQLSLNYDKFLEMFSDSVFDDSIRAQTNRKVKIEIRLRKVQEIFEWK